MVKEKKKVELSLEEKLEQALVPVDKQPYEVPENWCWLYLGSLLAEIKNGTTIKQDKSGKGYNVTRIESLQKQSIDFNRLGTIINASEIKETDWYRDGDIAMSHINSAEHVGKTAMITKNMLPLVHGMNLLRLRFYECCIPKYFQYYTQSYQYKGEILKRVNMAVNQVSINQKQVGTLEIPLPPLVEQQRIVEQIENLFSKVDEVKEKVQMVYEDFENRKSAILFKAYSGSLTQKWREKKGLSKNSWKQVCIKDVCKVNPPKLNVKEYDDDMEVSFFPMSSLSEITGTIAEPQIRKLGEVKKGFTNFSEGDVVFAKITPCMENGKSAIIGKLVNDIGYGTTEFYVMRCSDKLLNGYLYHLVRSKRFRNEAKSVMTGAVGQQRVPKSFMEEYCIDLPTVEEQREIIRLVDIMTEKEQIVVDICKKVLEQVDLMKKSILAKAFRGELGTNNLEEESSIELLKNII